MEARNADEGAVWKKAAICDYGVQVRIEIEKISPGLDGDACSRDCVVAGNRGFQEGARHVPRARAQLSEQRTVVHEIDPKPFGYAENPVPVGGLS